MRNEQHKKLQTNIILLPAFCKIDEKVINAIILASIYFKILINAADTTL